MTQAERESLIKRARDLFGERALPVMILRYEELSQEDMKIIKDEALRLRSSLTNPLDNWLKQLQDIFKRDQADKTDQLM